jgi:Protein of unknown function (DUF3891)
LIIRPIRPAGSSRVLITQPDHAALAARIMQHWRSEGFPESDRRSLILLAIEEHDNGWREPDAAPIVDEATGRILDFVSAPDAVRRAVWPRGVERLAATPYAAALVAQHSLYIYRRYRTDPAWAAFFADMEATRDRHLQGAAPRTLADLSADYFFVRLGDLASLTFCNAWNDPQTDESGYVVRVDRDRLIVAPDPFAGREVSIEIDGREFPERPFHSAADAASAFAAARTVTVRGTASGGR